MQIMIADGIDLPALGLSGDLMHDNEQHALSLVTADGCAERLSTNLSAYGLEAQPDTVFVKDWTEHAGLTRALVELGVVEVVCGWKVGQFKLIAYEVRPLTGGTRLLRLLAPALQAAGLTGTAQ